MQTGPLTNKTILILSPQAWGKMLLSKHHYAIELAKKGNNVFFLNPPDQHANLRTGEITFKKSELGENVTLIEHRLYFPFWLKFRSYTLFHFLVSWQVSRILAKLPSPVDIVWSFDLGNLYPLRKFPASALKVFHPVDEPLNVQAVKAAKGSDIIFSVTNEILDKYSDYPAPRFFIQHGVMQEFVDRFKEPVVRASGRPVCVGYSGNLLRYDMDRDTLLTIVGQNPGVEFHFFGSYQSKQSNIGGTEDPDAPAFITKLQNGANVKLHGVLTQKELASAFRDMDAFLICYDIERDQSKGTNYHKVMEYLSTGKVVVSNNITTYANLPSMLEMTAERTNNKKLPALFKKVIENIDEYNSAERCRLRQAYAADNTYSRQIDRISEYLATMGHSAIR